ncbi:MAG: hypothetical protein ACO1OB_21440 [Archangium sp.]
MSLRTQLLVVLVALPAFAAPRDFPFAWTNRTNTAGENGVEAWFTPRIERTTDFVQFDSRIAWAHGVTNALESQLSLDFDITHTEAGDRIDPRLSSLWRWAAWRGKEAPLSFGGQGRFSIAPDMVELEARLVFDVELGNVLFAFNAAGTRSIFWNGRSGIDTRLEENLALRYKFSSFANLGLEARGRSAWAANDYQGTAIYLGPTLTITAETFWISFGGLAQIAAVKNDADKALPEPMTLRDNERFVLRIAFGAITK